MLGRWGLHRRQVLQQDTKLEPHAFECIPLCGAYGGFTSCQLQQFASSSADAVERNVNILVIGNQRGILLLMDVITKRIGR